MATVEWTNEGTVSGKLVVHWTPLAANDVGAVVTPQASRPLAGAIQLTGTFGGAVTLQKSNDGTNWVTVKDLNGNDIAPVAAGLFEFSTAALYLRVSAAAGVSAVTATMVLRG